MAGCDRRCRAIHRRVSMYNRSIGLVAKWGSSSSSSSEPYTPSTSWWSSKYWLMMSNHSRHRRASKPALRQSSRAYASAASSISQIVHLAIGDHANRQPPRCVFNSTCRPTFRNTQVTKIVVPDLVRERESYRRVGAAAFDEAARNVAILTRECEGDSGRI